MHMITLGEIMDNDEETEAYHLEEVHEGAVEKLPK